MDAPSLLPSLIELERALDALGDSDLRQRILQIRGGVVQLQRENEELALQNAGLRERLRGVRRSTLPLYAQSLTAASAALDDPDDSPVCVGRPVMGCDARKAHVWRTTHYFRS